MVLIRPTACLSILRKQWTSGRVTLPSCDCAHSAMEIPLGVRPTLNFCLIELGTPLRTVFATCISTTISIRAILVFDHVTTLFAISSVGSRRKPIFDKFSSSAKK